MGAGEKGIGAGAPQHVLRPGPKASQHLVAHGHRLLDSVWIKGLAYGFPFSGLIWFIGFSFQGLGFSFLGLRV